MIILNRTLALALEEALSADHPVIGWHNIVTTGNVAADSAQASYPVTNLANPATHLIWKSDSTAQQYLTVTTNIVDPIDYLAIARHNLGSAQIAVSVEGRALLADPWSELVAPVLLPDDGPVLFRWSPISRSQVRLRMQAASVKPFGAVLYVGRLLVVERAIYRDHRPISMARKSRVVNGRSESGNFLGRIVTGESRDTSARFQLLDPAWYRANFDPFMRSGKDKPFFFGWRPGTYPREIGYAWLTNEPAPVNDGQASLMDVELQMSGVA